MKKELILSLVIILMTAIAGCFDEEAKGKATDFTLTDIEGNNFTLSDYLGEVVLINFFATWCGPCKEEMPGFVSVYEKYGNEIIMISIDQDVTESKEDVREFKQEYNAEWIFALDTIEENVMVKYDVIGIPMTFIVDTKGYISYSHFGPVEENEVLEEIEKVRK